LALLVGDVLDHQTVSGRQPSSVLASVARRGDVHDEVLGLLNHRHHRRLYAPLDRYLAVSARKASTTWVACRSNETLCR
jgi:hypothetical protein